MDEPMTMGKVVGPPTLVVVRMGSEMLTVGGAMLEEVTDPLAVDGIVDACMRVELLDETDVDPLSG